MRTDPVVVEKFIRGTMKGFLYSSANRTGTIAILARNLKVDEKTAAKIYDLGKSALTGDGTVNESVQKKALDFIARVQGLKDPDRWRNSSISRSRVKLSISSMGRVGSHDQLNGGMVIRKTRWNIKT